MRRRQGRSPLKLLLFDLDGTLLDRQRRVRSSSVAALQMAKGRGLRVSIATGRPPASAAAYAELLAPNAPLIHFNGAMVRDFGSGEVLFHRRLARDIALRAIEAGTSAGAHVNMYLDETLCIARRNETSRASELKDRMPHTVVGDLAEHLAAAPAGSEATKLLVIAAPERIPALAAQLRAVLPADIGLVNSEPEYLEVLPPGVNKGNAARALCAELGIDAADVAAVGDSFNDIELLEWAGLGVAMGNAPAEVAARADVVIGDNDSDAIGDFVRGLLAGE
ncbi:MAG: HAD family phosphatase [Myxococcales bacterium]|nr:HAD family phosphatase [Myxococcales bacterium]